MAELYVVEYGKYLVAINDSIHSKTYEVRLPEGKWVIFPSNSKSANMSELQSVKVPPKSCVVLRKCDD